MCAPHHLHPSTPSALRCLQGYAFDSQSGYYFGASSGLYFDLATGAFLNTSDQSWCGRVGNRLLLLLHKGETQGGFISKASSQQSRYCLLQLYRYLWDSAKNSFVKWEQTAS